MDIMKKLVISKMDGPGTRLTEAKLSTMDKSYLVNGIPYIFHMNKSLQMADSL